MSFLVRAAIGIALLSAACTVSKTDEVASSSEANLGEDAEPDVLPTGPLALDPTFAQAGTLKLEGAGAALALARLGNEIAVLRSRANGETNEIVLTYVQADGSANRDVVLPGIDALTSARLLAQGDRLVVVGAGARYFAARVGKDGALDPTFMPDPLDLAASDVAVDGSGRILVSGTLGGAKAAVVRLTENGALDTSFADGQGAWIDESLTSAGFLALGSDGAIGVAAVGEAGPTALRLGADGALDTTFGKGGKVVLPKNAEQATGFGLVAGEDGALTYYGPTADSAAVHAFSFAKNGTATPADPLEGSLLDARSQIFAQTTADTCTLRVATATTELSAAECAAGVPYVVLGKGRRAIAVTSGSEVSVRVFAR